MWLQELTDTAGLGHSNEKQKLQYHLRLKLQLEQMRHQCLVILRERFQLEQCIRCALLLASCALRCACATGQGWRWGIMLAGLWRHHALADAEDTFAVLKPGADTCLGQARHCVVSAASAAAGI